jgi:ABC-2 type transport system ATP-binding protein
MEPAIVAEDLCIHFRRGLAGEKIRALDGFSLKVRQGDFFALVGQNGAGKSTAMYCFLGLLAPASGRVQVLGRAPELGARLYETVAYLPEEPHYDLYLTVEEAVHYYSALYGKRVSSQVVRKALERLGLDEFRRLPLAKCSKGMKQKVGLAQCLIFDTRLLFLDEPTRGLDPLIVHQLRELLSEIHQRGATLVMNSHVLSEVEMMASRVAIIEKGKVLVEDSTQNLMRLDAGVYQVAFEGEGAAPDYVSGLQRQGNMMKGLIPSERLYDFMEFARASNFKIFECSLKRATLEESFVAILQQGLS